MYFTPYIAISRISAASQETYFTHEDEEKIRYMLSDRVGPATLAGYTNCGISIWKRFLATDRHWSNADLLLDNIVGLRHFQSDDDRIKLLVLYVYFLRQSGVHDVTRHCNALAHDFKLKSWNSLSLLLQSEAVMTARKHGSRSLARIKSIKTENMREAVSGEMLMDINNLDWCRALSSIDVKLTDRAVACLAGWLMVEFGLRVSNLLKTESDRQQINIRHPKPVGTRASFSEEQELLMLDRHVMRSEDVFFKIDGETLLITAYEFSKRDLTTNQQSVNQILLKLVSSKSNQDGSRRVEFSLERNPVSETKLMDMIIVLVRFAQYDKKSDMLFSRPHASRLVGSFSQPQLVGVGEL